MRVALLLALCLFSTGVRAEFSAKDYLARHDAAKGDVEKFIWKRHIEDTQNGMSWANSTLVTGRHETPLYCTPNKVVLTSEQLVDILKRYLEQYKDYKDLGSQPMALVLLMALQEDFPCNAAQK